MTTQKTARKTPGLLPASAALIAAVALFGCNSSPQANAPPTEIVQGLRVQKVHLESVPDEIEAPGSVIAASTAQVAARSMGTVTRVAVREGDLVKRGQTLAQIDDREFGARRTSAQAARQGASAGVAEASQASTSAQAQADVAQKTYDRYVYLRDQKSVSPHEFDEIAAKQQAARAGLEQSKARVQQAEAGLRQSESEARVVDTMASYSRIVAPFDGRIVRRTVEPGSLASPGMPVFVVEDTSHYQLEVTLPSDAMAPVDVDAGGRFSAVHRGTVVRVAFDALPGKSLTGKVVEIEAGADPSSHTLKARVDLPHDSAIQSGLFGRAWFPRGERRALVVPAEAVLARGQLRGIYTVDPNGLAHWRVITLGRISGKELEVLSGLSDGDLVVLNSNSQELDGKKIAGAPIEGGEKQP